MHFSLMCNDWERPVVFRINPLTPSPRSVPLTTPAVAVLPAIAVRSVEQFRLPACRSNLAVRGGEGRATGSTGQCPILPTGLPPSRGRTPQPPPP